MTELDIALTMIVKFAIILAIALVFRYVIPVLDAKFKLAKNDDYAFWASTFVMAADQILGVHCGTNDDKYRFVKYAIESMFPDIEDEVLQAIIEAAVGKARTNTAVENVDS